MPSSFPMDSSGLFVLLLERKIPSFRFGRGVASVLKEASAASELQVVDWQLEHNAKF
jgi:hypothetical protein